LAAIGAAWALGVSPSQIVEGLTKAAVGRPRVALFSFLGATIALSLCRNLSALNATINAIGALGTYSRRIAQYGVHGDIRIEDAEAQGLRLGQEFDELTLGSYQEGNGAGALLEALEAGARGGGRAQALRRCSPLEGMAQLRTLTEGLKSGQFLLIQAKDPSGMFAAERALIELGAVPWAGELTNAPIPQFSIESAVPQPTSNNV